MSLRLKNEKIIKSHILKQSVLIERALIYYLESFVAELENHAKENQGHSLEPVKSNYERTGNLVSSIGGAVLKDGRPISYKGFTGESEGVSTGREFLDSIISNYKKGYTILLVAGMEYASPVENYYGLNVLKKTELKMQKELPSIMRRLKAQIDRAA